MNACACVGAMNGQPVCPCRMPYYDIDAGVGSWALAELAAKHRHTNLSPEELVTWAKRLASDVAAAVD